MRLVFDDEIVEEYDHERERIRRQSESVELDYEIRDASAHVRIFETELKEALADVRSLDGPSGWFSKLLGKFETEVERAVAKVQGAKNKLAVANQRLLGLRARRDALAVDHATAEMAREAEVEILEDFANSIRGTATPAAVALDKLEAELQALEVQLEPWDTAMEACQSLHALHLRIVTESSVGQIHALVGLGEGGLLSDVERFRRTGNMSEAMNLVPEKARAVEQALSAVGLDQKMHDYDGHHAGQLVAGLDVVSSGPLWDWKAMEHAAQSKERAEQNRYESGELVRWVAMERKKLIDRMGELSKERERLLVATMEG